MREFRHVVVDIDRQLEDAVRAKQQLDAERWREELRSRAMRLFAARTTKLTWSRALLKLLIEELYPDDLFTELVGNLDRVPTRRYPHVAAVALALRHSWRRDGLTRLAKRLRLSLATTNATNGRHTSNTPGHHVLDSPVRLGPVKALRFAPTPSSGAHGLDWAVGRTASQHLRDDRGAMKDVQERRRTMRQLSITPSVTVTIGRHTDVGQGRAGSWTAAAPEITRINAAATSGLTHDVSSALNPASAD